MKNCCRRFVGRVEIIFSFSLRPRHSETSFSFFPPSRERLRCQGSRATRTVYPIRAFKSSFNWVSTMPAYESVNRYTFARDRMKQRQPRQKRPSQGNGEYFSHTLSRYLLALAFLVWPKKLFYRKSTFQEYCKLSFERDRLLASATVPALLTNGASGSNDQSAANLSTRNDTSQSQTFNSVPPIANAVKEMKRTRRWIA